jgi:hypothetical protein
VISVGVTLESHPFKGVKHDMLFGGCYFIEIKMATVLIAAVVLVLCERENNNLKTLSHVYLLVACRLIIGLPLVNQFNFA